MAKKRKGRTGWHQATHKTSKHNRNSTSLVDRIKGFVVTLVLWGLLPVGLANWLIHPGEPQDD